MRLILASSSPYRQQMLSRLGLSFQAVSPNINETPKLGESPKELALRLSTEKAAAVAPGYPGALIIGSDQVATLHGKLIGKPGNIHNARAQLNELSGQTVEFHSALCLTDGERQVVDDVITLCRFRALSPDEITCYLEREQPWDTAGSAKAESLGIALMDSMHSDDPTAIIGLPLIALSRMLRSFNINPLTYTAKDLP